MAGRRGTERPRDVFEWLDLIRLRPSMFFGALMELEAMLYGYEVALDHQAVKTGARLRTRHFNSWLRWRTGWSLSCGWARAITLHSQDEDDATRRFFALVDEFRQLRPTVRARVRLKKHHQPTGARRVIGMDGRMEVPRVIEAVQYAPAPLFFLRMHYPEGRMDDSILVDNGREATSLTFAKRWVREELQVRRDEWD